MSDSPSSPPLAKRSWLSLAAVLFVQTQNAFNDNFVKFVLMGLAMAVAAESAIGKNIEYILAAMIPLPFILLAPVAGYMSDRFSKRDVIFQCLLLQLALFVLICLAIVFRSVEVAVLGFFLLAVQSTFFSPAKQGILKEIVGSERLGFANGLMSMLTMVGILGGMWLAGYWFDMRLASKNELLGMQMENGWSAALVPVIAACGACLIAIVIGRMVEKTPAHAGEKFSRTVWIRHFIHLKELFSRSMLRSTALFITGYWLVANFLGLGFVQFAKEIYPNASKAGRMTETAKMLSWVGAGLIVGSVIVSLLSRKRIQYAFSPWGGIGMALGLGGVAFFGPGTLSWNVSLLVVGFASGFYVIPLNAWLQDIAEEDHRARVISALNLMTAFSGIVAIGTGKLLQLAGLTASQQVIPFAVFLVVVSALLGSFLKRTAALR
ncbi:MAG: hypothetical protein CMO55_24145 [Verrucomicrobiales bacterium]|nr:hypothetical protein [Verrucomicrobiales bacterium]